MAAVRQEEQGASAGLIPHIRSPGRAVDPRLSMKQLILYDLDGTLVDTREDLAQAINHALRQMGRAPMATDAIARFVGLGLNRLVGGCLRSEDPAEIEHGSRLFEAHYAAHLLDHSRLYPGVREVLGHFKSRRQAVVTNKPDPFSRRILTGLGIAGYFFEVVAANGAYPKKPDPAGVLALMGQAKVEPHATVLIGDSRIDVETSRNAGIMVVGMAQGFEEEKELADAAPDAFLRNFRELLDYAKQRGW